MPLKQQEVKLLNKGTYVLIDTSVKDRPEIYYGDRYSDKEPNSCIIALISILSGVIFSMKPEDSRDIGLYNRTADKFIAIIKKGLKAVIDLRINTEKKSRTSKSSHIPSTIKKHKIFSTKN